MFHLIWVICCFTLLILVILRVPKPDNNEIQASFVGQNLNSGQKNEVSSIDVITWFFLTFYIILSSFVFSD